MFGVQATFLNSCAKTDTWNWREMFSEFCVLCGRKVSAPFSWNIKATLWSCLCWRFWKSSSSKTNIYSTLRSNVGVASIPNKIFTSISTADSILLKRQLSHFTEDLNYVSAWGTEWKKSRSIVTRPSETRFNLWNLITNIFTVAISTLLNTNIHSFLPFKTSHTDANVNHNSQSTA